jgi:predicted DNA-binding transcriptional regulator AlpA
MSDKRVTSAATRDLCGGVSDMTIWRWLNDPSLNFPKPVYIGRRRYWVESEVVAWLNSQPSEMKSPEAA